MSVPENSRRALLICLACDTEYERDGEFFWWGEDDLSEWDEVPGYYFAAKGDGCPECGSDDYEWMEAS